MDTGPVPFQHFKPLNHAGNVTDSAGNELYGCHSPGQGYLNLMSPEPGKVYYWGSKRLYDYHYAVEGWQLAKGVKNAPPLPGTPVRTPLDTAIQTPTGLGVLMEMGEELAGQRRAEKSRRALSHLNDDGGDAFEAEGYSIQERAAAQYAPKGNGGNPYQRLPGHGITYTNY